MSENNASKSGLAIESIVDYRKRTGKSVEEMRGRDYGAVAVKACKAAGFNIRFVTCRYDAPIQPERPPKYKVLVHTEAEESGIATDGGGNMPDGEDQLARLTDALHKAGFIIVEATMEQFYADKDFSARKDPSTSDAAWIEFRELRAWVKPGA
jgi:hypothetical protein